MSYRPCDHWSNCTPVAEGVAIRNFSAENADLFSAFGLYQCSPVGTNPPFESCTSLISQANADFCSAFCYPSSIYVNEIQSCSAPCGSSFTVPAGKFLGVSVAGANATAKAFACASVAGVCSFSNSPQSCTVLCADNTLQTYTVPNGILFGPSQAAVNALAAALACEFAALGCFGTLFSNTAQSCDVLCPQTGGTVTVVIAAGAVLGLSQESANARAVELACALALIACDSLPPLIGNQQQSCSQVCLGVTIAQTVPAGAFVASTVEEANAIAIIWCYLTLAAACAEQREPDVLNVGNGYVNCSVACAGGGSFTFHVAPNSFRLENRSAADAAAQSYCQSHVVSAQFCLGDIDASACVNSVYASAISAPGATAMGVTSGVLPPGLSLSAGLLAGIAATSGSYTFTITAVNAANNRADRTYTINIGEITPDILPDGAVGTPYAVALTATGFAGSVTFSIVGGALPDGLALLPFTGGISGTPTTAEDAAFVVSATDGALTCEIALEILVTGVQVQAYWRLEGPPAANHDEITGGLLTYNNFGAVLTSPAAVVGNGLDIGGAAFCTFQQQGPTLAYAGPNGFSVALWIRWSSAGTGNEGFIYQWENIGDPGALSWIAGTGEFHFLNLGGDTTGNTAIPAADVFHFAVFTYDPTDNNLRFSVDGAAFVILGNPGIVTPIADPTAYLVAGNEASTFDEVQLYSFALRAVDVTYLYNAGAGRVYPPSFPP